jgi:hypothetical protein
MTTNRQFHQSAVISEECVNLPSHVPSGWTLFRIFKSQLTAPEIKFPPLIKQQVSHSAMLCELQRLFSVDCRNYLQWAECTRSL